MVDITPRALYNGLKKKGENSVKRRIFAVILIFSTLLSIFSCEKSIEKKKKTLSFLYFDAPVTIHDYSGLSKKEFAGLVTKIEDTLFEYHKLYDIYTEYEGTVNLATLNKMAGKGAVKVDKKIVDLLLFAKEMYTLTGGEVNIAMGSVLKIWHKYREEKVSVPTMDELRSAAEHTDIEKIVIDEEKLTVELLDPEMSIDVGAVAKGYAAEMLAASLEERGYSGIMLDVGRNLRAVGTKPDGTGWQVGVVNPNLYSSEAYVHYTELISGAIVTSGSYERRYNVGGKDYHHIIDKDTLMPVDYYASVSIECGSSALADALSTAIFNMTPDEAYAFVKTLVGVKVVFVYGDGRVEVVGERIYN